MLSLRESGRRRANIDRRANCTVVANLARNDTKDDRKTDWKKGERSVPNATDRSN